MSVRGVLLCLTVLSLAVITLTLRTKKPLAADEFGVTDSEIPFKLSGKFATLTGQTSSTSNLVFDRKLYQIEASATVAPPKHKLRFLPRSAPKVDDTEDVTVNYKIKFANAAATPLACGKLDWVENPIVQCWELSPKLAVGYTAAGMTMHWVTPEGKRRIASFASYINQEQLPYATTIDILVSATDSDGAFFLVTFVVDNEFSIYSFKVDTELGSVSQQEEGRQRTLLEKRANFVFRGDEVTAVCTLVCEPVQTDSTSRSFIVKLELHGRRTSHSYTIDKFGSWIGGVPTIDLFTENQQKDGPNFLVQLFYYRPWNNVLTELVLGRRDSESCIHDYHINYFSKGLRNRQTRHWMWLHTPTNGHATITHAFLSKENSLYLIPQKVLNPSSIAAVGQAKYSMFMAESGNWQLKRQERTTQGYYIGKRRCPSTWRDTDML